MEKRTDGTTCAKALGQEQPEGKCHGVGQVWGEEWKWSERAALKTLGDCLQVGYTSTHPAAVHKHQQVICDFTV